MSEKPKLKISTLEQLKARFQPTKVMRFINREDETDYIDFIVRKIDPSMIGTHTERDILQSLTQMQTILELSEEDVEKMTPEEIVELLNVDTRIADLKNNDAYVSVATAYSVIDPNIPASEVLHTLPMSFAKVITDFTVGNVPPDEDAIEGFQVVVLDYEVGA